MKKSLIFQFFVYTFVLVVLIYVYYLTKENFGAFIDFKSYISSDDAKINIKKFTLDETQGDTLAWKLYSDKASLYDNKNLINLLNNSLFVYQNDITYFIKSNLGNYDIEKKLIKLYEKVEFSSKEDFVFYTDELYYFSDENKIESKQNILAKHLVNNIEITGSNLAGDIELKEFSLSKNVIMNSKNDDLNIKSNRVKFLLKSKQVVFYDNVRAIKKDINIFCNKMDIYYNEKGFEEMRAYEKIKIIIEGNKKAYSKIAILDEDKLILKEKAIFIVNEDEFKGDEIIYNIINKDFEIKNVSGTVKNIR